MPSPDYARAIRSVSPDAVVLTALEIRHRALPEPVRVVNAVAAPGTTYRIEGEAYVALRFSVQPADDVEGRTPGAEVVMDNVGRELMAWVEAAEGGIGATVRLLQVLDAPGAEPEWETVLDVARVKADQERLVVSLGYDPLLGRAAVAMKHDPETSPGLF